MKTLSSNEYYVYEYVRLDTGEPFYIGKGKGDRWKVLKKRNKYFTNIVNKHGAAAIILHDNLTEKEALEYECWYIWQLRDIQGYSLVNLTDGGDGVARKHTKEEVEKRWVGENNPFFGRQHTEEFKITQRERFKERFKGDGNPMYGQGHKITGEKNGFYGKKHSTETIDKIKDKVGTKVKGFNKDSILVYKSKKDAYNHIMPEFSYGKWKYMIGQAIKNKTELCGFYWEEV